MTSHRHTLDCDLLIIGAGPIGLYAAYYAGFRGLSVAIVESLPTIGGQVSVLFPEKVIYDVAGLPSITGRELIAQLETQAASADPVFLLGRTAVGLSERPEDVLITLDDGSTIGAGAVLVSAGVGSFKPRQLPAAAAWHGRGLEYVVQNTPTYAGLDVVIAGGGDSAVDWALHLESIARTVTVIHRRNSFRAHERSMQQLYQSSVDVVTGAKITNVLGTDWIDSVEITRADGTIVRRTTQALICALGFIANLGPIAGWGMTIRHRRIAVDPTMRTNLERVFAVGDVSDYPSKVRLISVGFGEAATAVNHAAMLLRPGSGLAPGHSSDRVPAVSVG